jgi:predicted ATPase
MLTAIQLGNFKSFAETQRVPIRPLTLIYGANSSGKSSIIHSLILIRHALEEGSLDVHRTRVGGDSVDLGGFRQYVHRREANRRMEWSADLDASGFRGRFAELLAPVKRVAVTLTIGIALDDQDRPLPEATPELHAYEIQADGNSLLRMSKRRDGNLQLDRLNHEHPVFREVLRAIVETSTTAKSIQPSDYEGLNEAIANLVPEIVASRGKLLPKGLLRSEASSSGGQEAFFPISKGRRKEDLAAAVRFFIPRTLDEIIKGISDAINEEMSRLRYLGPLRSYPPRHLAFSQHHDPNWFAGGGYAWDEIRKRSDLREKVNKWLGDKDKLGTPYELRIRNLLTIDDLDADYTDVVEELEKRFTSDEPYDWDLFGELYAALDKLKSHEGKLSDIQELNLIDRRNNTIVTHRDVGIGISQVLPVIVATYALRETIYAIEQPEIHLHPKLQSEISDLFIESALGEQKNRFIIETHSEHLLLRIMRRMRETATGKLPNRSLAVRPEDVMVLYVEPDGTRSIIREMPLNEHGELVKAWPGGFFEEGLREIF